MSGKVEEEVKISEKIKFWEEQEQINNLIIERLVGLRKETGVQASESEFIKEQYIQSQMREEHILKQINEIEEKNNFLNKQLQEQGLQIKELIIEIQKPKNENRKEKTLTKLSLTTAAVAILISIFAIVL